MEQVTLLTETAATRCQILAAFDQLIEQIKQNPEATAIIYYSGHGGRIQSTHEYFLVPYGYNPCPKFPSSLGGA
jgi:Caspase domain